jgi:hypothetical protein
VAELWFRNVDARFPFLHDNGQQPEARWYGDRDGPARYLADTPDGAWAELLRHEEIDDEIELSGIARDLWVVEIDTDSEIVEVRGGRTRVLAGARAALQAWQCCHGGRPDARVIGRVRAF